MKSLSFTAAIILLLVLTLASCKRESYPPNPVIEYEAFSMYGADSAEFILHFTDGDGDIGLDQGDTSGSFGSGKPYYYNFIATYYYRDTSGNFVPYDAVDSTPLVMDTLRYRYRIPNITPEGQNKVLDGEIRVHFTYPYFHPDHEEFKFDAFIYDRSLQKSNVITTPALSQ